MQGEEEPSLFIRVAGGVAAAAGVRGLLVAEDIEARGWFEGARHRPCGGINRCRGGCFEENIESSSKCYWFSVLNRVQHISKAAVYKSGEAFGAEPLDRWPFR